MYLSLTKVNCSCVGRGLRSTRALISHEEFCRNGNGQRTYHTPSAAPVSYSSHSPSAILFDAFENFSRRSPKADESIRSIRPELAAAVNECVDAAAREWEPVWQKRLLNVWHHPSLPIEALRLISPPGSQVRTVIFGPVRPIRLHQRRSSSQSAQRRSLL